MEFNSGFKGLKLQNLCHECQYNDIPQTPFWSSSHSMQLILVSSFIWIRTLRFKLHRLIFKILPAVAARYWGKTLDGSFPCSIMLRLHRLQQKGFHCLNWSVSDECNQLLLTLELSRFISYITSNMWVVAKLYLQFLI